MINDKKLKKTLRLQVKALEVTCKFKIFLTSKGDKQQTTKHQNKPLELKVRDIKG